MSGRPALWDQRSESERLVALEVLLHGPLARSDLARRLSLSPASLTRLVAPMLDAGLVEEVGGGAPGSLGRPTRPLRIVAEAASFLGVRLTPDAAHGVVASLRAEVLAFDELPLGDRSPAGVTRTVADLVARLRDRHPGQPTCLGVSLGGLVLRHEVVRAAPFFGWTEPYELAAELRRATGIPTVVDNDVLALTRAQSWFGVARGWDRFALVTIGPGIGLGLVTHGELVDSPDAGVGLAEHLPLSATGPVCPRGHTGCAEAMLSSEAIAVRTGVALRRDVDYDEALDLAVAGDPAAAAIVEDSARALGRLLALVANIAACRRIVVSGEGARLARVAEQAVRRQVAADRDPRAEALEILPSELDKTEWARGPAALAIQASVRPLLS